MDNSKEVRQYQKSIIYKKEKRQTTILFNKDEGARKKEISEQNIHPKDSQNELWQSNAENNFLLSYTPDFRYNPFSFRLILYSSPTTKMYLKKGRWKDPHPEHRHSFVSRWLHLGNENE
jgi:hypothetical protein